MLQHNRLHIFALFLGLWIVVIGHEAIPHYHPHGDGQVTKLIGHLPVNTEMPANDESGILDNLIVLHKKKAIDITPFYQSISANSFHQIQFWSAKILLVNLKNYRYFKPPASQLLERNTEIPFRGPPNLI